MIDEHVARTGVDNANQALKGGSAIENVVDLFRPAAPGNCERKAPSPLRERILMCAPDFFGVNYVINPWMKSQVGKAHSALAQAQWENLRRGLAPLATLEFMEPAPGAPDMAFTANAGLVIGAVAVVSRFRDKERKIEEPFARDWFRQKGFIVAPWPEEVPFEGAGDALLDRAQNLIWCGHGWRTSEKAVENLERIFGLKTVGLRLVDPRFYHLDTCFCPLSGGWIIYYPPAFDEAARRMIASITPQEKRIEVGAEDALSFACNAVEISSRIFLNSASSALQKQLRAAGFEPVVTPLTEFVKAGGAAKCLTLKLENPASTERRDRGKR